MTWTTSPSANEAVHAPTPRTPESVEAPLPVRRPKSPAGWLFDGKLGANNGPLSPTGLIGHLARCSVWDRKAGIEALSAYMGNRRLARLIHGAANSTLPQAQLQRRERAARSRTLGRAPMTPAEEHLERIQRKLNRSTEVLKDLTRTAQDVIDKNLGGSRAGHEPSRTQRPPRRGGPLRPPGSPRARPTLTPAGGAHRVRKVDDVLKDLRAIGGKDAPAARRWARAIEAARAEQRRLNGQLAAAQRAVASRQLPTPRLPPRSPGTPPGGPGAPPRPGGGVPATPAPGGQPPTLAKPAPAPARPPTPAPAKPPPTPAKPPPPTTAKSGGKSKPPKFEPLGSVTHWGRIGPLDAALIYIDMHAKHFEHLADVRHRVALVEHLLSRVEELEAGARTLNEAADKLVLAELEMPTEPLPESEEVARGGISMVTQAELAYVEQYRRAAAAIWNQAWKANSELNKAISGWEAVVAQAKRTDDFTQKAAWEAVIQLDKRFSNAGGSFRAFLANALTKVQRVQWLADGKHRIAAEILGKSQ